MGEDLDDTRATVENANNLAQESPHTAQSAHNYLNRINERISYVNETKIQENKEELDAEKQIAQIQQRLDQFIKTAHQNLTDINDAFTSQMHELMAINSKISEGISFRGVPSSMINPASTSVETNINNKPQVPENNNKQQASESSSNQEQIKVHPIIIPGKMSLTPNSQRPSALQRRSRSTSCLHLQLKRENIYNSQFDGDHNHLVRFYPKPYTRAIKEV